MGEGPSVVHAGIRLWALSVPPEWQPAWILAKKWEQCQLFSEYTAYLYYSFFL